MSEQWVTSDLHFYHKNILKYQASTRPWSDMDEMTEGLIERYNARVKPNDECYILGDVSFAGAIRTIEVLKRMNGKKYMVLGNHDHVILKPGVSEHFEWVRHYHEMHVDSVKVVMFHYPIFSWNRMHFGAIHLYGHTHGHIPTMNHGMSKDIGVDTNDCYPYNLHEVVSNFKKIREDVGDEYMLTDPRGRPRR